MYYIEKNDKPIILEQILNIINIQDNRLLLPIKEENINEKKSTKLAEKTNKILKKTNSNKIILSKELYKNEIYKNILYSYGYDIVDGKWLFEALLYKILDYVLEKNQIKKEESQISILVNNLTDYTLENIKIMSNEFKTINIVTNHIEKFKKIEEKIYQEKGLMITVTNNKKKSLVKSKIILNIDFPNELINKYNIFDEAIIINIYPNIKINKKRFNGLLINDYEITVNPQAIQNYTGSSNKYFIKHLYEAEFYKNIPYSEFKNTIKDDTLKIKGLYGVNGKILWNFVKSFIFFSKYNIM